MSISGELKSRVLKQARKLLPQQIKWRRHLHQSPELSAKEFETTAYIRKLVGQMGLEELPVKIETGLMAELEGKRSGRTVAIRTDIDALPVTELTGLEYRSKIEGRMHACGHDVHMAVVLGTAALLKQFQPELSGKVRFLFQPAEEQPPGGARPLIASGALKDVSMIFGLHVDPTLLTGRISLLDGVAMGAVADFDLTIEGVGGHAARPHDAVDAIVVAAGVIESIQKIISREIDPIKSAVITFGKIEGGIARNIICDRVRLTATARTLSPAVASRLKRLIKRTAVNVCRAHGARAHLEFIAEYPALNNHPSANRILAGNFKELFPKGKIELTEQVLGGEDFACYLEKVAGAMFRLGSKNKAIGADQPWHSPKFIVDEEAIFYGTSLLTASVLDYLKGSAD